MLYIIRRLASILIVKASLNTSGTPNYDFPLMPHVLGIQILVVQGGYFQVHFCFIFNSTPTFRLTMTALYNTHKIFSTSAADQSFKKRSNNKTSLKSSIIVPCLSKGNQLR